MLSQHVLTVNANVNAIKCVMSHVLSLRAFIFLYVCARARVHTHTHPHNEYKILPVIYVKVLVVTLFPNRKPLVRFHLSLGSLLRRDIQLDWTQNIKLNRQLENMVFKVVLCLLNIVILFLSSSL